MNLKETYNKIAEDWYKDHDADTWWQEGTDKFISMLSPKATVLDMGCGAGQKTRYMHNKGVSVMGLDFSENMIEVARRAAPDIKFNLWDIYEIDKFPQSFDAIFAQAVLLHIPKSKVFEVLQKLISRLNDGGLLYLSVKEIKDDEEEKVETEKDYGYEYSRFFSYYNLKELEGYMKKLNMKMVWNNVSSTGRSTWLQIIARK